MRKTNILTLAALFCFGLCSAALAAEGASRKIVIFKKDYKMSKALPVMEQNGWQVKRNIDLINAMVVDVPEADSTKIDMLVESKALPGAIIIEDDFYANWLKASAATLEKTGALLAEPQTDVFAPALSVPNVTPSVAGSDPEIPWGISKVGAPEVWYKWTGKGIKVGIVDTGIDLTHPDLAPNIVNTINVTTGGPGQDDQGHGTHVAGTIAAVRDGKGVVGVAPEASIYAAKVLGANGSGSLSDVVTGIDWVVKQGVQVINMSLGSPSPAESLRLAVQRASEAGVAVVCAAGNDSGPVGYPAAYEGAIAISAGDESGNMASFSSHGPQVAFIAPGVNVYSTYLGGQYKSLRGTSMASPHVAGLAVLAVQGGAKDGAAVLKALKGAAKPSGNLQNNEQGAGMINAGDIEIKKMLAGLQK